MSIDNNRRIAGEWARAFNAYDVDALIALYADDATHTSPKIRVLHPESGGKLSGKAAIDAWWRGAIGRTPGLRYESRFTTADEQRVYLEYIRHADGQEPMLIAEVFDVVNGKIVASRVFHG